MRKSLWVSLLLLIAVSLSPAQFGIKGEMNLGTFWGEDKGKFSLNPGKRTAFTGGISYNIGLIAGLSLQPEVMYIQRGTVY